MHPTTPTHQNLNTLIQTAAKHPIPPTKTHTITANHNTEPTHSTLTITNNKTHTQTTITLTQLQTHITQLINTQRNNPNNPHNLTPNTQTYLAQIDHNQTPTPTIKTTHQTITTALQNTPTN